MVVCSGSEVLRLGQLHVIPALCNKVETEFNRVNCARSASRSNNIPPLSAGPENPRADVEEFFCSALYFNFCSAPCFNGPDIRNNTESEKREGARGGWTDTPGHGVASSTVNALYMIHTHTYIYIERERGCTGSRRVRA